MADDIRSKTEKATLATVIAVQGLAQALADQLDKSTAGVTPLSRTMVDGYLIDITPTVKNMVAHLQDFVAQAERAALQPAAPPPIV